MKQRLEDVYSKLDDERSTRHIACPEECFGCRPDRAKSGEPRSARYGPLKVLGRQPSREHQPGVERIHARPSAVLMGPRAPDRRFFTL